MLNFTGQTKKRVVNLGNRRPNNSINSRNYLEQTRLQRQKREEQRQIERSGNVLQTYIRRYLDLNGASNQLQLEWTQQYERFRGPDSEKQALGLDWTRWLIQFVFISKWSIPHQSIALSLSTLSVLHEALREYGVIQSVSDDTYHALIQSLVECIKSFNALYKNKEAKDAVVLVVKVLKTILGSDSSRVNKSYQNIIFQLQVTCDRFGEILSEEELLSIVTLVCDVNVKDSPHAFIQFLGSISIVNIKYPEQELYGKHLSTLRIAIPQASSCIASLSNDEKANLLVTVLRVHGKDTEFLADDYIMIGSVLSTISFSIYNKESDQNAQEADDDIEDGSKNTSLVDAVYMSEPSLKILQVLYSSSYIKKGIHYFTNNSFHDELSRLALHSFAALIYLIPQLKSKLCMLLTITSGSYTWFYNQLKNDPIYKNLESTAKTQDYAKADDLIKFYGSMQQADVERFWKTLFTFEELYSYWLIVSNDLESFAEDKLMVGDVSDFLIFLKTLCLTLVFNNMPSQKQMFKDYSKLKDISLSLLNQLYMKNLRLKFLPKDFWKLKELHFNIDSMLQIIATEEERRIELEDASDGEDIEMESDNNIGFSSGQTADGASLSTSFPKKPRFSNTSRDTLAKLEVLKKLPFFLSFKDRVKIFQTLIDLDRQRLRVDEHNPFDFFFSNPSSRLKADIRREYLLKDAFESFHKTGTKFKHQLSVTFFNEYGGQEAGIDGGGITKEFLTSVVMEGFKPDNAFELFKETSENQIYPNEDIFKQYSKKVDVERQREKLLYIKFLGSVIGKCFYENVLIDVSFAPFFLNKWCNTNNGMKNSINDLNYLDHELFVNLMKLLQMSAQELDELELNFTIEEKIHGRDYKFDLLPPNGEITYVNASNRLNYIHQVSNFKLNQSLHIQSKFFLDGLFEIIDSNWLSMFDSVELQMLISGGENDINIQDWKENVEYGGYFDDDATIVNFWQVVNEMSPQERFKLIKFVTSVSRAPLLGFGSLNPKFGIRNSGRSVERLPTASTCVNLLKLPDYQDKELIRSKLLYAINTDAHFDLS